jgi:hypothetical protein
MVHCVQSGAKPPGDYLSDVVALMEGDDDEEGDDQWP